MSVQGNFVFSPCLVLLSLWIIINYFNFDSNERMFFFIFVSLIPTGIDIVIYNGDH